MAPHGLDTDGIVSAGCETSRKLDEVYGLIKRKCHGGCKIEILGRKHNTQPRWVISHKSERPCYLYERWPTLRNYLGGDQIHIWLREIVENQSRMYPFRS